MIVMIFGGGGAKAAAHIGAMRALEEEGLAPQHLLGTSMGGVFAALFAAGLTSREVLERALGIGQRDVVRPERLALLKGLWATSLLKPAPLRGALERLVDGRRFEDLRLPLTITATALDTGELTLFGAGGRSVPLLDALYASCALPLFFPPGVIEGRSFADGGLRAVLPLEAAAKLPAKVIIAVDVGPGFDELETPGLPSGLPPVVDTHNTAMTILMSEQTQMALALWRSHANRPPLLYVRPKVERGATFRVDLMRGYVEEGYRATRAALAGWKAAG